MSKESKKKEDSVGQKIASLVASNNMEGSRSQRGEHSFLDGSHLQSLLNSTQE